MYVIALHQILNPETAFPRGQKLMVGDGAPAGVRVLQFFPAVNASHVTCLWEGSAVDSIQEYVDDVLGDSSINTCYAVNSDQAFAERPLGLPNAPALAS